MGEGLEWLSSSSSSTGGGVSCRGFASLLRHRPRPSAGAGLGWPNATSGVGSLPHVRGPGGATGWPLTRSPANRHILCHPTASEVRLQVPIGPTGTAHGCFPAQITVSNTPPRSLTPPSRWCRRGSNAAYHSLPSTSRARVWRASLEAPSLLSQPASGLSPHRHSTQLM